MQILQKPHRVNGRK